MPAAWNTPLSHDPPLFGVAIGAGRSTLEIVREYGEMVINLPGKELLGAVMLSGKTSSRAVDKFKAAGLTRRPSRKLNSPGIEEARAHLECRVVRECPLGDHVLVVGEVVFADALEGTFGETWLSSPEGIHHLGGAAVCFTGERIEVR